MALNLDFIAELAAKRRANKAQSQAIIANSSRVAKINNSVTLSPEELAVWGRENASNLEPINISQTTNTGNYKVVPTPSEVVIPVDTRFDKTEGVNQFFKPTATVWEESPISNQRGRLPFLKSDLRNANYSIPTMAAQNQVMIGNEFKDVIWRNEGKNKGVQPYLFGEDKRPTVPLSSRISPQEYEQFMAGANVPDIINETKFPKYLKQNPHVNPNNYFIKDTDATGEFVSVQSKNVAEDNSNLPNQGSMWGINQELNDINKAEQQALLTRAIDSISTYRGSNNEASLRTIDAVARAGGSGTWTDDNVELPFNPFRSTNETRSASMAADDLARGGTWQSGKSQPSAALPDLTQEDFISDRIAYSPLGYPVDTAGTSFIPKGVANLAPASEFLEPAAQWKFQPQREVLRFPTTAETPLTLAAVNEFGNPLYPGNPENAYYLPEGYKGRTLLPLSVQRKNGTLDLTQLSSRGRWMGGGIAPGNQYPKDRSESGYNPLSNSYYKVRTPVDGSILRLRSDTHPLTLEAQAADKAARDAAAQYQEAPIVNPFTRQYKITETGKEIPGFIPGGQIKAVTLPVMVEQKIKGGTSFEPDYMPYAPRLAPLDKPIGDGLALLDQHLADARIEIDGARYPLTPEATTTEFLPTTNQLSAERNQLHGRTRIDTNDNVSWWNNDGPSDAELDAIATGGKLDFDAAEDIRQTRGKRIGLAQAYADPSIAPTDIVSATEAKQRELNVNNALLAQEYPYQIQRGIRQATNKLDLQLLATDPMFGFSQSVGIHPRRVSVERPGAEPNIGQAVTVIHTDADGNLIQRVQRPATSFVKQRKVVSDDGTEYLEDVGRVDQRDLADIFDGNRARTLPELAARSAQLESEISRAKASYAQLMGMEPESEIQITTNTMGRRKARNLAEQMQQAGMEVSRQRRKDSPGAKRVVAIGSLPIGMPADSAVNLPVKYNSQEVIDPEVQAIVEQGRADTVAAQRLIDFNNQYRQSQRPKPIITETRQQELADIASTNSYGKQLADMLMTPPADTAANRAYNQLMADQQLMSGRKRKAQTWGQEPVAATPEPPQQLNFVEEQGRRFRGGRIPQFPQLPPNPNRPAHFMIDDVVGGPAQRPRVQNYDQSYLVQQSPSSVQYASPRSQGMPSPLPLAPTPTGIAEPRYVDINDLLGSKPVSRQAVPYSAVEDYMVQPQSSSMRSSNIQPEYYTPSPLPLSTPHSPLPTPYSLPNWALPAGAGVYLAAAGVNEYQRQQEQRKQQEESALRRLYNG